MLLAFSKAPMLHPPRMRDPLDFRRTGLLRKVKFWFRENIHQTAHSYTSEETPDGIFRSAHLELGIHLSREIA